MTDIVERIRSLSAYTSKEAADEIERLRTERDAIKQQAQQWKMEASTQASIVRECYQICTGATGEPGDWHGAEPVRKLAAENAALLADAERYRWLKSDAYAHALYTTVFFNSQNDDELDVAIDAAMKEQSK